jgi:hypothetical protein
MLIKVDIEIVFSNYNIAQTWNERFQWTPLNCQWIKLYKIIIKECIGISKFTIEMLFMGKIFTIIWW